MGSSCSGSRLDFLPDAVGNDGRDGSLLCEILLLEDRSLDGFGDHPREFGGYSHS